MPTDPREVLTRTAPPPDTTVRYGPLPEHLADVRWGPRDAPLAIVVHGGFWRSSFDRQHTGPQCAGLAEAGLTVATIEYRRTGQDGGGWPGTFEDVGTAVDTVPGLVRRAGDESGHRVDTARTVLVGHSAGGHLVAWAVTTPRADVVAAVSLAGVLDLQLAAERALGPAPAGSAVEGSAVEALLGGGPTDVPGRYAGADPSRLGSPLVPVTAVHGDADQIVPLELSASYTQRTGQRLVVLKGIEHFGVIDPLSPCWPEVVGWVQRAALATPG